MRCPKCDSENPPTGRFCNACGATLDVPPPRESRPVVSPAPGASGEPVARAIGGDVGMVKGDVVSNVTYYHGTTPESSRATKSGEFCDVCGRLLKDDYHRCPQCGKLVCPGCFLPLARGCQLCVKPPEPVRESPAQTSQPSYAQGSPTPLPGKSATQARLALDELLEQMDRRDLPAERQIGYFQDFSQEWSGTSAAREAEAKAGELKKRVRLLEEAKEAYAFLLKQESPDILTQSQADSRRAVWDRYLAKYEETNWQLAEARQKASYYQAWRPIETFDLGGGVELEMAWVPGGTFQMGAPDSEFLEANKLDEDDELDPEDSDEGPVHTVELDGFWMGKYEVTVAQFGRFISATGHRTAAEKAGYSYGLGSSGQPERHQGWNWRNAGFPQEDNYPVVHVGWIDSKAFCDWLSRKEGKEFRLPTEAEWEYACRAGNPGRFCFGDSDSQLGQYAWFDGNSGNTTHPVGRKQPNAFGLYDMHGNVREYCSDWYNELYYRNSPRKNPTGPSSGQYRVIRGGHWRFPLRGCRSAFRGETGLGTTNNFIGFRVVCVSRSQI